jgi:hypothetical protein
LKPDAAWAKEYDGRDWNLGREDSDDGEYEEVALHRID